MNKVIQVVSSTIEEKVLDSCSALIAAFFPGKYIKRSRSEEESEPEFILAIEYYNENNLPVIKLNLSDCGVDVSTQIIELQSFNDYKLLLLPGKEPLRQILIKRAVFIFLVQFSGKVLPWGILTGMRPGKLMNKMDELHFTDELEQKILHNLYLVNEDKAALLKRIIQIQQPFIRKMNQRVDLVGIYIMIPFCPSRCFYCSFPSNPLTENNDKQLQSYMEVLHKELELTGKMMREMGLRAASIYIGGGTPTVLKIEELEKLLMRIHHQIPLEEQVEFTIEAGRPDTINLEKLSVMKNYQVNRLSINPQTMQDFTLEKIGRRHKVKDILECFSLAREYSDWIINMDLILGLPDEGFPEIKDSIEQILVLKPDNLTIHSLALKRGSLAWENSYVHSSDKDWTQIQNYLVDRISSVGYRPYYLYRQKNIAGDIENVGYAMKGKECKYNIAIIEEKQNIIGLGAGAVSKILKDRGHKNIYHSVDLIHYRNHYKDVDQKRTDALRDYLDLRENC